jgi:hypothetical protein
VIVSPIVRVIMTVLHLDEHPETEARLQHPKKHLQPTPANPPSISSYFSRSDYEMPKSSHIVDPSVPSRLGLRLRA